MRWASRSTARARRSRARCLNRFGHRRRRPMPASGWAPRSTSGCACSTPSSPAAPAPGQARAPSPGCSRSCLKATTTTSRSPRGAGRPRRSYRDGAGHRRARPVPLHQRAEIGVALDAAVDRPGLSRGAGPRPQGHGHLFRYGRTDPAWCLSAGLKPGSDEAIGLHPALEAFLAQNKAESTSLIERYQRLAEIVSPPPPAHRLEAPSNHRLNVRPQKNPLPYPCAGAGNRKLTLSRDTHLSRPL
jgi:hypothetical protein